MQLLSIQIEAGNQQIFADMQPQCEAALQVRGKHSHMLGFAVSLNAIISPQAVRDEVLLIHQLLSRCDHRVEKRPIELEGLE